MGRTRTKKKGLNKAVEPLPKDAGKEPTTAALLEKAQNLIVQCDYPLARRFITRILEREPFNAEVKELLGVVQLETGDIDAAKATFQSLLPPAAHAPSPPPPSAHLYLAQLNDDDPKLALQHYQAAVEILTNQLKGKQPTQAESDVDDELELKNSIVRALIGQVEIWMDPSYDLCFEPEAESTCENLLQLALQYDPGNAEALQALASVRLSQQRPEDAKQCLEASWTTWKDLDLDNSKVPPIQTRIALVKLFLELSLFQPALQVLQGIMSSDDQQVEAWYLEGWCYFVMSEVAQQQGGVYEETGWQDLARDSRDRLEACKMLHIAQEYPDIPLLEHVQELVSKLDALGIQPSPADEDEPGEWEDVDSSGDEDGDVQMMDS